MQEPEIFEQPVANKDSETTIVGDEIGTFRSTTVYSNGIGGGASPRGPDNSSLDDYHDFVYPEDRKLGTWSTAFLIINRVVGAGIYSTPSNISQNINSVGVTLLFWVLGGIMTFW